MEELPVFEDKFYWNTVMPVHLRVAYGFFHTVVPELNSSDRKHSPKAKNIDYLAFHRKFFLTPGIKEMELPSFRPWYGAYPKLLFSWSLVRGTGVFLSFETVKT